MKKITHTTGLILIVGIIIWVLFGGYLEQNSAAPDMVDASGEITEINTSQIAFDGPILIMLDDADGDSQTLSIPSFGFNLCPARDDIVDPFELSVGDMIEVSGQTNEAGEIMLCNTANDYLRLQSSDNDSASTTS